MIANIQPRGLVKESPKESTLSVLYSYLVESYSDELLDGFSSVCVDGALYDHGIVNESWGIAKEVFGDIF